MLYRAVATIGRWKGVPMRSVEMARPTLEVSALITDSYDGMIRLLNDAQRFGLSIVTIALQEHAEGSTVRLVLDAGEQVDPDVLRARLSRHPCLRRLNVTTTAAPALPRAA
jgi:hypothetical protein